MQIKVKEIAGWMAEIQLFTDAPMGDSFKAVIQLLCVRGSSADTCNLRVTMKVCVWLGTRFTFCVWAGIRLGIWGGVGEGGRGEV